MAFAIHSTAQVAVHGVKCLVYGRAGTGKTRMCATAPAPFIFSAESGLLSLRKVNLPYHSINTLADLIECYNWMKGAKEARQFQTFCLDSISEIAEVVLAAELRNVKDPRQAYGALATKVFQIIRDFRDFAGPNIYFTAKEDFVKDDQIGGMFFSPNFPGNQIGRNAPYFFDEVFRLSLLKDQTTGQNFAALQTQPDNNVTAKDRSGALDFWEQPDLSAIFRKIAT